MKLKEPIKLRIVKCPGCRNVFPTRREKTQCPICGVRFIAKENEN